MTVEQLIETLKELPNDFEIKFKVIREIPEDELETMSYKYPYEYIDSYLVIGDKSYSDKTINFEMNI